MKPRRDRVMMGHLLIPYMDCPRPNPAITSSSSTWYNSVSEFHSVNSSFRFRICFTFKRGKKRGEFWNAALRSSASENDFVGMRKTDVFLLPQVARSQARSGVLIWKSASLVDTQPTGQTPFYFQTRSFFYRSDPLIFSAIRKKMWCMFHSFMPTHWWSKFALVSREILPHRQDDKFTKWMYTFGRSVIEYSTDRPLVSGFYKLLSVCMTISTTSSYFKVSSRSLGNCKI